MVFYLEAGDQLVLSGFQQQLAGDQGRGGWRERDCQRSQVDFISNICCQALDRKISRMNDSGNIKCVATNVLGRATTVANLTIEASPRLELPENYNDGLIFRYDEVIRMKIPLIAKPPPRITWFFDDEPISASEDVQIEITDTLTSLRIGAAKRWHCGEFR